MEPSREIDETDLNTALTMIRESERPFICVGGGAILSDASEELYEFVKKVDAPVADTPHGTRRLPGDRSSLYRDGGDARHKDGGLRRG